MSQRHKYSQDEDLVILEEVYLARTITDGLQAASRKLDLSLNSVSARYYLIQRKKKEEETNKLPDPPKEIIIDLPVKKDYSYKSVAKRYNQIQKRAIEEMYTLTPTKKTESIVSKIKNFFIKVFHYANCSE